MTTAARSRRICSRSPTPNCSGRYQKYCQAQGIDPHPARFPPVPEYFIRMLTDPGDMVIDPFGGSCVTGEVERDARP